MILIIGTPDSGKSAFAESLLQQISEGRMAAYIATMIPFGEAGQNRIKKHKKLRERKPFVTMEEPFLVSTLVPRLNAQELEYALLECVSNLVGNVMHREENKLLLDEELVERIVQDIRVLDRGLAQLVVVTNSFTVEASYDADTKRYIALQHAVNEALMTAAEKYFVKEDGAWVEHVAH